MITSCAVDTGPRRFKWPLFSRTAAGLVLVVAGSAAAALLGLVAEETLPKGDEPQTWTAARWLALSVALVFAVWATVSLSLRRSRVGTLYYLRLQNETNEDWHRSAVMKAAEEYLSFRSISAWCDPGEGTVDVRQPVAQMSEELQRALNDDADDSGFDIAPNLIFPVSLAMGFDWIPPKLARLREFNRTSPGKNVQAFQWDLECVTASGEDCARRHTEAKHPLHFRADSRADYRLTASTRSAVTGGDVASVWLEFWLTDTNWMASKSTMKSPHKDVAEVFRQVYVEGPEKQHSTPRDYCLLTYGPKGSPRSGLSVLQIAEGATYWLERTLAEFPNATVFVAGGMPKTVALAMGYLMTQPPMRGAAAHPWRRIVPMGHFQYEPEPELRPMWVRADQVDPDLLIAAIRSNPALIGPGSSRAKEQRAQHRGPSTRGDNT